MLASSSAAAAVCAAATTTGGCCDAPFLWLRFATVVVAVAVAVIVVVGVVVGVVAVAAAADVLREFLDRGGPAASGNEPSAGVDGLLARPLLVVTTVVAIGVGTFAPSPF